MQAVTLAVEREQRGVHQAPQVLRFRPEQRFGSREGKTALKYAQAAEDGHRPRVEQSDRKVEGSLQILAVRRGQGAEGGPEPPRKFGERQARCPACHELEGQGKAVHLPTQLEQQRCVRIAENRSLPRRRVQQQAPRRTSTELGQRAAFGRHAQAGEAKNVFFLEPEPFARSHEDAQVGAVVQQPLHDPSQADQGFEIVEHEEGARRGEMFGHGVEQLLGPLLHAERVGQSLPKRAGRTNAQVGERHEGHAVEGYAVEVRLVLLHEGFGEFRFADARQTVTVTRRSPARKCASICANSASRPTKRGVSPT